MKLLLCEHSVLDPCADAWGSVSRCVCLDQPSEGIAGGERRRNARYAKVGESEIATLRLLRVSAEGSTAAINSAATTRVLVNCSASGMPSKAINSRQTRPTHADTATRIAATAGRECCATSDTALSKCSKRASLNAQTLQPRDSQCLVDTPIRAKHPDAVSDSRTRYPLRVAREFRGAYDP